MLVSGRVAFPEKNISMILHDFLFGFLYLDSSFSFLVGYLCFLPGIPRRDSYIIQLQEGRYSLSHEKKNDMNHEILITLTETNIAPENGWLEY